MNDVVQNSQVTIAGSGTQFAIVGPLTFATVEHVVRLPVDWHGSGEDVTVDLAQVPRADSAGLALLVEWWREARLSGRALHVINIPARLHDLIRVNGLQALFPNQAPPSSK